MGRWINGIGGWIAAWMYLWMYRWMDECVWVCICLCMYIHVCVYMYYMSIWYMFPVLSETLLHYVCQTRSNLLLYADTVVELLLNYKKFIAHLSVTLRISIPFRFVTLQNYCSCLCS